MHYPLSGCAYIHCLVYLTFDDHQQISVGAIFFCIEEFSDTYIHFHVRRYFARFLFVTGKKTWYI